MTRMLPALVRLPLLALLCLLPLLALAQDPPQGRALWVGETDGVVKVAAADGSVLLQLDTGGEVRALAVDGSRGRLWVYGKDTLTAYGFDGSEQAAVAVCRDRQEEDRREMAAPSRGKPGKGGDDAPGCRGGDGDAALIVDSEAGYLWLARGKTLLRLSADGTEETRFARDEEIRALTLDAARGRLWLATKADLLALDRDGETLLTLDGHPSRQYADLAYDPFLDGLWAVSKKALERYDADGTLQVSVTLKHPQRVAIDGRGSAWVATRKFLYRVDASGHVHLELEPFGRKGKLVDLVADPADGSAWSASQKQLAHYDHDGALLHSLDFRQRPEHIGRIRALALYTGAGLPSLSITAPVSGAYLASEFPEIELTYEGGFGVDPETLGFTVDGADWPFDCDTEAGGARCTPVDPLPEGLVTLVATISDQAGTSSEPAEVAFTVDTVAPEISVDTPQDGAWTATAELHIAGGLSEPADLTLADTPLALDLNHRFEHTLTLAEGENRLTLTATDWAGNESAATITVRLDTLAPPPIPNDTVTVTFDGSEATVQGAPGSAEPGARLTLTNARTGESVTVTVEADGSFTARIPAQPGDALSIRTTDAAGNTSGDTALAVPGDEPEPGPEPGSGYVPPDPADFAPPLDPTVPTTVHAASAFLYTGPDAIQHGIDPATIEPHRTAVLRGSVLTREGEPLSGVTVSIHGYDEYGWTGTRADGLFDLVVNGGGWLTVRYEKAGYLPVQRQIDPRWADYDWLPEVVMLPLDPQVTTINLSAAVPIQTARGSLSSDADGPRQATLLFPQGTAAELVMPDGSTRPLSSLDVRATEYTVGENGPKAMPGELPPTSGYTYAVELSVDEAIAAGAKEVRFDRPVPFYLENFLDFPIGGIVPAGWYDRDKAAWIPSDNGRIVEVLAVANGLAELDVDGSGSAAGAAALAELGISEPERRELAALYAPGQSLWRVPMTHFTPWDLNWPFGPPPWAVPPTNPNPNNDPPPDDPTDDCNSIIECESAVLGETLALPGTPFALHYRSHSVPGYRKIVDIPLIGEAVPQGLKAIELRIGAPDGYQILRLEPSANLTHRWSWTGNDRFGRPFDGTGRLHVGVGYVYEAVYYEPAQFSQAFAGISGVPITRSRQAQETTLWQEFKFDLRRPSAGSAGLGGWTLTPHHQYEPASGTLYHGDGTQRTLAAGYVIDTVLGTGEYGYSGDGGAAAEAAIYEPWEPVVAPNGDVYVADYWGHAVRRVATDGTVTTVAGTGQGGDRGDGGPANLAELHHPRGLALGPDGSLYIADGYNNRIRKVNPDGIMHTVAGTGAVGYTGDGGPADQATLFWPSDVEIAADGRMFIADNDNHVVRVVGTDGNIHTYAGTGQQGFGGDGGPAGEALLNHVRGLALAPDGSLYIADNWNHRIRKVSPNGIIETVAGTGEFGYEPDGALAKWSALTYPEDVVVDAAGTVYFTTAWNNSVRMISATRRLQTIAGIGELGSFSGDGGPATDATFDRALGLGMAGDGTLYVGDFYNHRVRRLQPLRPLLYNGHYRIPSEDGVAVYEFDEHGRHMRTYDARFGTEQWRFEYGSDGWLTAVIDLHGNRTDIERDGSGGAVAVVGPYGARNDLELHGDGYLASVTDPAGAVVRLQYAGEGLLTSFIDANGYASDIRYDADGRLLKDQNAAGGFLELERRLLPKGVEVTKRSTLGRVELLRMETTDEGFELRSAIAADGTEALRKTFTDGTVQFLPADGSVQFSTAVPEPRFGMLAPVTATHTLTTPQLRTLDTRTERHVEVVDRADVLSLVRESEAKTVNGRIYLDEYEAATRQRTTRTPEGRTWLTEYDLLGLPVRTQASTLAPVHFIWDARGRVTAISIGSERDYALAYGGDGNLASLTDPLGREQRFEYDAAGRLTRETLPDGRSVGYAYDPVGNLIALTPPGRSAHRFDYTPINQEAGYTPPALEGVDTITRYTYNLDKQLTSVVRPDGQTVSLSYDSGGRVSTVDFSRGALGYAYDGQTGQLATITTPDGGSLALGWDGPLPLSEQWNGEVSGSVHRGYDDNLWLRELAVNGEGIAFDYDNDGLLTRAGALTLVRDAATGLVNETALGSVDTERAYTRFGELERKVASANAAALLETRYVRDALGRITEKRETSDGVTTFHAYTYDAAGRLAQVLTNGAVTASYSYDANGNRLSRTAPDGTEEGTYDAQDRLLTYAEASYTYTANGELASKTENGSVTNYDYDELGNLRRVTLPGDDEQGCSNVAGAGCTGATIVIDYIIDGRNRRIGKKVNGTLVQGFLYQDQLNPVAELDGSGNVVARFVYAEKSNVPAYMVKEGKTYRIISDHLGSPRSVVDTATGEVVQRLEYDEFGRVLEDSNTGFQPFGFAGGIYDQHTGLVRFGARDYDSVTGRWTAKDPIRFGGKDTGLYSYVLNDPINWFDPDGARRQPGSGRGNGTAGNPRPPGSNLSGRPGSWHRGQFYPSMGEPWRPREQWEQFTPADLLPSPNDWHEFYDGMDFGNGCALVCGEGGAGNGNGVNSCSSDYGQRRRPSMQSCRLECRD